MLATTIIANRFRVLSELGQGGFSKTYIAEDLHLPDHPKCVIKQLQPMDPRPMVLEVSKKMFEREAQVLYRLGTHDRIPSLLAHFDDGTNFYLALEYVEGKMLSQEITKECHLSQARVLEILEQTLSVLQFVHQQNVIHRDIKPANIIRRSRDGQLVLIDFGAVKEVATNTVDLRQHTHTTVAIGSPGYMPDEQANGRPKFASDIYALGVMAIQALTGVPPTQLPEDANTGEILWKHLLGKNPISDNFADYLSKMVLPHFSQRWRSADEALAALEMVKANPYSQKTVSMTEQIATELTKPTVKITQQLTEELTKNTAFSLDEESLPTVYNPRPAQPTTIPTAVPVTASSDPTLAINREVLSQVTTANSGTAVAPTRSRSIVSLATLVGICTAGIAGVWGWQSWQTEQFHAQELAVINNLLSAGQYRECTQRASAFPATSARLNSVQELATRCQAELTKQINQASKQKLESAKKLAKDKKFREAIVQAGEVNTNSPSYKEALTLTETWSKEVLKTATKLYQEQGKLKDAETLLQSIPAGVPTGKSIKATLDKWRKEHNANQKAVASAKKAVAEAKWSAVLAQEKQATTPYWKKQMQPYIDRANVALAPPPPVYTPPAEPAYSPSYSAPAPSYSAPAYNPPPPPALELPPKGF